MSTTVNEDFKYRILSVNTLWLDITAPSHNGLRETVESQILYGDRGQFDDHIPEEMTEIYLVMIPAINNLLM